MSVAVAPDERAGPGAPPLRPGRSLGTRRRDARTAVLFLLPFTVPSLLFYVVPDRLRGLPEPAQGGAGRRHLRHSDQRLRRGVAVQDGTDGLGVPGQPGPGAAVRDRAGARHAPARPRAGAAARASSASSGSRSSSRTASLASSRRSCGRSFTSRRSRRWSTCSRRSGPDFLGPHLVLWSIANVVTWTYTGYNMLIIYSALQAIPQDLYEAARLDGASGVKIAWTIKVPIVRPAIVLTAVFSIVGTLQLFTELQVFETISTNVTSTYTPNLTVFTHASANNYHYAAALSVLLALVTFVLSLFFLRTVTRPVQA